MDFDLNILRSAVTVLSFVLFLGLVAWTYARSRASAFDEAAELPFQDDRSPAMSPQGGRNE